MGKKITILILTILISQIFSASFVIAEETEEESSPDNFDQVTKTGPIPPEGCDMGSKTVHFGQVVLSQVPSYHWHHGCTPTSVAMVFGYYDKLGFDDLFIGSASSQTSAVNERIASKGDGSGSTSNPGTPGSGHIADYAFYDGVNDDSHDEPYPDMSEVDPDNAHFDNCIADYLRTSRSANGCHHGWTSLSNIYKLKNYCRWANSSYNLEVTRHGCNGGNPLTWELYCQEIDLGRPVVLGVHTDLGSHSITAIGYRGDEENPEYACYNTWHDSIYWHPFELSDGSAWTIFDARFFKLEKEDPKPVACFTFSPHLTLPNDIITFTGEYSYSPLGKEIINYSGDCGDETTAYGVEVSHQYNTPGNYIVNLIVRDKDGNSSEIETKNIGIVDLEQRHLDVSQKEYNSGFILYDNLQAAQSFLPNKERFSIIRLFLRKIGNPTSNLSVELRSRSVDGLAIGSVLISSNDIQTSFNWIDVIFDDMILKKGLKYYIVLSINENGGTDNNNCFEWAFSINNPYEDGMYWQLIDGNNWESNSQYDFTLKTYDIHLNNQIPISEPDSYSGDEDNNIIITAPGVLDNDDDPDDGPIALRATLLLGPMHGFVDLNFDGSFRYTPEHNFHGSDFFYYHAYDGIEYSHGTKVSLSIISVEEAPVAVNNLYTFDEDQILNIEAPGILGNDYDDEPDTMTVEKISDVSHGTLNLYHDGSFNYNPDPNYNGFDSFTYKAFDGNLFSDEASVSLRINSINDNPIANDDSYFTSVDKQISICTPGILDNDIDIEGDSITVELVDNTSYGDLKLIEDGSILYIPQGGWTGQDTFTYKTFDGQAYSDIAIVTITVYENSPPVSHDDGYVIAKNSILIIESPGVLENDFDIEEDSLTAILENDVNNGILTFNEDGSFSYIPQGEWTGQDTFAYKIYDGEKYSELTIVKITVTENSEIIDINQDIIDRDFTIRSDSTIVVAQSFIPNYNILSHIDINLKKYQETACNLSIAIREECINGPQIFSEIIPSSQIDIEYSWIVSNTNDLTIDPGKKYYIVISFYNYDDITGVSWGYSTSDNYVNGMLWMKYPGENWKYDRNRDFSVRTFSKCQESDQVYVNINAPESVELGNNFDATVDVSDLEDFDSGSFSINFDSTIINVSGVVDGSINGQNIPVTTWYFIDSDTIRITVDVSGSSGLSGSGYLSLIQFEILSVGTSDISINNIILYNTDNQELNVICFNDTITVEGDITYSLDLNIEGQGTISKDPDQTNYTPGTSVELTAISDPGWIFYEWLEDLTGSENPKTITMDSDKEVTARFIIIGDAGQEGSVNTGDITLVERMIMDLDPKTPEADANQDGRVDAGDITAIEIIIMNQP